MTIRLASFLDITRGQNLFVLAATPRDVAACCGALIAEAALRGRPPFVAVLADGSADAPAGSNAPPDIVAAEHERATRHAAGLLGVPHEWFLMLGLIDGTVPMAGRKFDAVVDAVGMLMWRRDCNAIVAPWSADRRPGHAACHAIAAAVASRTGVSRIGYRTDYPGDVSGLLSLQSARGWDLRKTAGAATFGEAYEA